MIAHIAPIKFGIIARLNQKNKLNFLYVDILFMTNMAEIHSITEEICINQVPNDNSCKILYFFL